MSDRDLDPYSVCVQIMQGIGPSTRVRICVQIAVRFYARFAMKPNTDPIPNLTLITMACIHISTNTNKKKTCGTPLVAYRTRNRTPIRPQNRTGKIPDSRAGKKQSGFVINNFVPLVNLAPADLSVCHPSSSPTATTSPTSGNSSSSSSGIGSRTRGPSDAAAAAGAASPPPQSAAPASSTDSRGTGARFTNC
jgi:hypothetical protein